MHPHGLISLTEGVDSVPLGTLAARTALAIETGLINWDDSFLLKRVRFWLKITGVTADEGPHLVFVTSGDVAASEATAGMVVTNATGPSGVTENLTQDTAWVIMRDTVRMMRPIHSDTEKYLTGGWIKLKGKGIPTRSGVRTWIFNAQDAAFTTGSVVEGLIEYQGVWLND